MSSHFGDGSKRETVLGRVYITHIYKVLIGSARNVITFGNALRRENAIGYGASN